MNIRLLALTTVFAAMLAGCPEEKKDTKTPGTAGSAAGSSTPATTATPSASASAKAGSGGGW